MPASDLLLMWLANVPVLAITFVLARNLLITFNWQLSYILADILTHISDYSKSEKYIFLYINLVEQVTKIFNQRLTFADSLIKALKKNKSFVITQ